MHEGRENLREALATDISKAARQAVESEEWNGMDLLANYVA